MTKWITSCNQLKDSVTRCCKISPLWQHLKRLWILFEDLLALGKIFNIICTNCICYWTIFHFCKCPKIEQIILPSGHTGGAAEFILITSKFLTADPNSNFEMHRPSQIGPIRRLSTSFGTIWAKRASYVLARTLQSKVSSKRRFIQSW